MTFECTLQLIAYFRKRLHMNMHIYKSSKSYYQ